MVWRNPLWSRVAATNAVSIARHAAKYGIVMRDRQTQKARSVTGPFDKMYPRSELNNRPDGCACVHQIKALVDVIKREFVGDHRVNLNLAVHVPVYDLGHIRAA